MSHQESDTGGFGGTQRSSVDDSNLIGGNSIRQLSLYKHLKKKNANDAQLLM